MPTRTETPLGKDGARKGRRQQIESRVSEHCARATTREGVDRAFHSLGGSLVWYRRYTSTRPRDQTTHHKETEWL